MKKKLKGARDILMNLYGNSNKLLISDLYGQVKEEEKYHGTYTDKDTLFKIGVLKIAIDIHKEYFITGDIDFVAMEKHLNQIHPKYDRSNKLNKILN
jgi:hypothetical protein